MLADPAIGTRYVFHGQLNPYTWLDPQRYAGKKIDDYSR